MSFKRFCLLLFNRYNPFSLRFLNWRDLDKDLAQRHIRLAQNSAKFAKLQRANAFQLAATDLFVEKAQIHLTKRARANTLAGIILSLLCFGFLAYVTKELFKTPVPEFLTWEPVVVFALRGAAIAGFAGGAVYFLASLSRAFFHEATTLYNRRHALRFGRMFVYLKYGEADPERDILLNALKEHLASPPIEGTTTVPSDPSRSDQPVPSKPDMSVESMRREQLLSYIIHRDVDAEDLEKAFGWNLETYTGFRDMRPEQMSANVYSRTLELMTKVVETVGKLKKSPKGD